MDVVLMVLRWYLYSTSESALCDLPFCVNLASWSVQSLGSAFQPVRVLDIAIMTAFWTVSIIERCVAFHCFFVWDSLSQTALFDFHFYVHLSLCFTHSTRSAIGWVQRLLIAVITASLNVSICCYVTSNLIAFTDEILSQVALLHVYFRIKLSTWFAYLLGSALWVVRRPGIAMMTAFGTVSSYCNSTATMPSSCFNLG